MEQDGTFYVDDAITIQYSKAKTLDIFPPTSLSISDNVLDNLEIVINLFTRSTYYYEGEVHPVDLFDDSITPMRMKILFMDSLRKHVVDTYKNFETFSELHKLIGNEEKNNAPFYHIHHDLVQALDEMRYLRVGRMIDNTEFNYYCHVVYEFKDKLLSNKHTSVDTMLLCGKIHYGDFRALSSRYICFLKNTIRIRHYIADMLFPFNTKLHERLNESDKILLSPQMILLYIFKYECFGSSITDGSSTITVKVHTNIDTLITMMTVIITKLALGSAPKSISEQ